MSRRRRNASNRNSSSSSSEDDGGISSSPQHRGRAADTPEAIRSRTQPRPPRKILPEKPKDNNLLLLLAVAVALLSVGFAIFFFHAIPDNLREILNHPELLGRKGRSTQEEMLQIGDLEGIVSEKWPHLEPRFAIKPLLIENTVSSDGQEDGEEDACKDSTFDCTVWATLGECEKNPNYMLKNCRRSCRVCDPEIANPDAGAVDTEADADDDGEGKQKQKTKKKKKNFQLTPEGDSNVIPKNDGHFTECRLGSQIRVMDESLTPVTEALEHPMRNSVFVMRNGRNEGIWVSWPEVNVPEDAFLDPYRGCLHDLVQKAGSILNVPLRILRGLEVQVVTHHGILVPTGFDVRQGMRLHLVLPHELFQWPGIAVGHKEILTEWSSQPQTRPFGPVVMETLSLEPKIFRIQGLLTESEADEAIQAGITNLRRSSLGITGQSTGKSRTSSSSFIPSAPISYRFRFRAFDLARIPFRQSMQDGMQLVQYQKGQFFRQHTDYFNPDPRKVRTDEMEDAWADRRFKNTIDRYATFFVYLNTVPSGGETVFPRAKPFINETIPETDIERFGMKECEKGLAVKPRKAEVVLFYNMLPEMQVDSKSIHGGCPPAEGLEKFGANFWIWNNDRFIRQNAKDPSLYS